MSKPVWDISQPSNISLGTFVERKTLGVDNVPIIHLQVTGNNVTISLISGELPGGLRLEGLTIIGTPFAVIGSVTSRFVLRAKNRYMDENNNEQIGISDRTFTITISSLTDSIQWSTPEGLLPVGANYHYYILDNSWIDFQFDANDTDIPSDMYLNYHIPPNGGELPKGLTLSKTGRLTGFTAPIIDSETGYVGSGYSSGNFDINFYDKFGYDYGIRPTNGFDSFYFDSTTYDFYNPNRAPKKLNRHYNFIVRATNRTRYVDRKFQIYVVGDDYMRTDNDILRVGTNTYSADNTYIRKPIWITKNYLGRLRANNYITLILDVFDPATLDGYIGYLLAQNNNEVITRASWTNGDHVDLINANNWLNSGAATGYVENVSSGPNGSWLIGIVLTSGYTTGLGLGSIISAKISDTDDLTNAIVTYIHPTNKLLFTIRSSVRFNVSDTITQISTDSISVANTTDLKIGMNVYVTSGTGSFLTGSKIVGISGNTFTVSTNIKSKLINANVYAVTTSATINVVPVDDDTIIGNLQIGHNIDCSVDPVFLLDVIETNYTTGRLTCGSTKILREGMAIVFSGQTFGNIVPNLIYYVKTIIDSKNFTISKKLNGPNFTLKTETGIMSVSYPSSKIPKETIITGWNYSGEYSSKGIYSNGEIIKYKKQLYKVISQNPITNISPLDEDYFQPTSTFTMDISWDSPNDLYNTRLALLRIGTPSVLPPGMELDTISGEVYGSVPSQSAITQNYKFTVIAIRYGNSTIMLDNTGTYSESALSIPTVSSYRTFNVDIIGDIDSVIHFTTDGNLGTIDANFISNLSVNAVTTVTDAVLTYKLKSGKLPNGLTLVNDGTIQGKVNQFSDGIRYRSVWKPHRPYSVNDVVRLITHDDLNGKYYRCTIAHTGYRFINSKWEIYKDDSSKDGLITFDQNNFSCDNFITSFDKTYTFTIEARDQFNESSTDKTFRLTVATPNDKLYSNIHVKPFLKSSVRNSLVAFFNDTSIFETKSIYRSSDPNFGVQNELKMLLYSGIESKLISDYVSAFGRSSRKKFRIGNMKKAIAKTPGTNDVVYELIYLEVLDNLENENGSISSSIKTSSLSHQINVNQGQRDLIDSDHVLANDPLSSKISMSIDQLSRVLIQDKVITVDFGGQLVSDLNKSDVFGNSVTNLRKNISLIGETERKYLPLWMRTPQTYTGVEQGFTKAVPICYCVPGTADNIMLNIKNSGFDFKIINYTIDRVIINGVVGDNGDKYIAFAAREVING